MTLSQRLRGSAHVDQFSELRRALTEHHPDAAGWLWSYQEMSSGASFLVVKLVGDDLKTTHELTAETAEECAAMVRAGRWTKET